MGRKKESVASLGRGLMRAQHERHAKRQTMRHTSDESDASDLARLNLMSITEESALNNFLSVARLANTKFKAERENIEIISEEKVVKECTNDGRDEDLLLIPRRPQWNTDITPQQLLQIENESFLVWRRSLAVLQEKEDVLMTPFEKNIEFWRQLWRVVERSDVIVQIVDARNPLLYICKDLHKYVKEVDGSKMNVLLLNKADLLTDRQRLVWAQYFDNLSIKALFFSALEQTQTNEIYNDCNEVNIEFSDKNMSHLLSRYELVAYFKSLNKLKSELEVENSEAITIGFVGYPNVGKSSTINALLQTKRVSVSATPGKTKHFQTHFVDDQLLLCDCPGLVFPSFVSSKAEMIINGILSIDNMTDAIPSIALLTSAIPRHVFEKLYGIALPKPSEFEEPSKYCTAQQLLSSYGYGRGFMTQRGLPDISRSARYILKDFVCGKLLYCKSPPNYSQNEYHVYDESSDDSKQMTQPLKRIMESEMKLTQKDFDKSYFNDRISKVHTKGMRTGAGNTKLSFPSSPLFDQQNDANSTISLDSTINQKPWKKHNNRNKKAKLRNVFAHLDQ